MLQAVAETVACSIYLVFLSAINSSLIDCTSWPYIRILALSQYRSTHRIFDVLVLFSFSANFGNNRATCVTLWENVTHATCATLKMLNGQTLKSATSDYDQRHVIAFRPISVAARSWSYDKVLYATHTCIHKWNEPHLPLLPSRRASPHFGQYLFPIRLRGGGSFGLGGWWNTEVILPAKDGYPSQY